MAPGASKWSNLNLQILFGACLCVKTPRFGVGKVERVVSTPPPYFLGLIEITGINKLNIPHPSEIHKRQIIFDFESLFITAEFPS